MNQLGALIGAMTLLCGCVSSGTQIEDSALAQFQKGVTTQADVIRALGPPQNTSNTTNGLHSITYAGLHAQPKASSFIPIVGAFTGGASSRMSVVTFIFGDDGKLQEIASTQTQSGARTGIGAGTQAPAPTVVK